MIRGILFVTGSGGNSRAAVENLRIIVDRLGRKCAIQIIDVLSDHSLALQYRVVLSPTLVIFGPTPVLRIAGTLIDHDRVLALLQAKLNVGSQ